MEGDKELNSRNPSTKLLEEAVEYFTSNPGFSRLLKGMLQKYQSLGRWGGSVNLNALKADEKEALSTFFRQDYSRQQSASISLERFAQAFEETRFSGISVLSLLEKIQGEPLVSNAETLAQKEQAKNRFFNELASKFTDSNCQLWLRTIKEKHPGTRLVHQAYETTPDVLYPQMLHVLSALSELNSRPFQELYRLPIFARRITKDPHGFDSDTERGRLLISALRLIANDHNEKDNPDRKFSSTSAEELTDLYYSFGILRDDLWNFVTCTGILATSEEDQPTGYLLEAYREGVTLNLPLREVVKLTAVSGGQDKTKAQKIFIVENSGVFSALLDNLEEFRRENNLHGLPNPPLICTHGQFKLASLLLFEKLTKSGATLYYSGDFDPEGLLMADRLLQRCPGQVFAWHYGFDDYKASLSDQQISAPRLKKLEGIVSAELIQLKEEILRTGLVGYQEGIIEQLWKDVKGFIKELVEEIIQR